MMEKTQRFSKLLLSSINMKSSSNSCCFFVFGTQGMYLVMKLSCFVCYHYSVISSKSLKVAFFSIEGEVTQCNKCIYPLSTTSAKYQKQKILPICCCKICNFHLAL
jgi:hypothetical protein